jgi:GxxExxY protein
MPRKTDAKLLYKEESYIIQGGAFNVYKEFRNRHKEKIYRQALIQYLKQKGLDIEQEKQIPIYFESKKVGVYIPDIVVNNCIFIELKCKPYLIKDDIRQFWYYLRCSDYKVGYLINFGSPRGVQILRRIYDTARSKKNE